MTDDKLTLTRDELITIMEDAFVDGWNTGKHSEFYTAQDFLEEHKEYKESSETTVAIDNLRAGA